MKMVSPLNDIMQRKKIIREDNLRTLSYSTCHSKQIKNSICIKYFNTKIKWKKYLNVFSVREDDDIQDVHLKI